MTLYERLQVDKNASKEVIIMAYKALAKMYHPDVNPEHLEIMKEINRAKEILTDDFLRAEYDQSILQSFKSNVEDYQYDESLNYDVNNTYRMDQTADISTSSYIAAGPWKRYFAKMIDFLVLGACVGYVLGQYFTSLYLKIDSIQISFISELILTFFVVIVEGILISLIKTTPGKWMFSLQVTDESHEKLSLFNSLYRSISSFIIGIAFGVPILSLFTLIHNFDIVKKEGRTRYDKSCNSIVIDKNFNYIKFFVGAIGVFILIGFIFNNLYLNNNSYATSSDGSSFTQAASNLEDQINKERTQLEKERASLLDYEDYLTALYSEVQDLENELEDFPEYGDQEEYEDLYDEYELKWNKYDSDYNYYEDWLNEFNEKIDAFNKKYGFEN